MAECGECEREFTLGEEEPDIIGSADVTPAMDGEIEHGGMTISAYMREHGVEGGVSLEDSADTVAAQEVLETDSARKYAVGSMLAQGGMGAILNCRDLNIRRNVAMKVMLDPEKVGEPQILRFIEEAQVTGQLEHPGIVPVYELGVDAGENVFYTMKFVRGKTIKEILEGLSKRDPETVAAFPLTRLLNLFLRVCEAMAYAHHKNVIHRDLKPENIMIGDFGEVYVMDWGLAKVLRKPEALSGVEGDEGREEETQSADAAASSRARAGEDRSDGVAVSAAQPAAQDAIDYARDNFDDAAVNTLDGAVMGTPQYMAPEQARGKVAELDQRADVYALGAILYEILSLQRAVTGKTVMALLMKVSTGELVPLPTDADPAARPHCPNGRIPDSLAAVAMKALALKPDDRYATVQELQTEIEAYHGGFATVAEEAGLLRQLGLLIKRHKTEFSLAAAAVIILAAVVAGFVVKVNTEKNAALVAKREAETQRAEAQAQRTEAEAQRARATEALGHAQYENYRNVIALADRKIAGGEIVQAEKMLWDAPKDLRGWEWGRCMYRCHGELLALESVGFSAVYSVAFSPDGRRLVTGNSGSVMHVWDSTTGETLFALKCGSSAFSVAFSPDGRLVASGHNDKAARLWDAKTGELLWELSDHKTSVMSVAFSPDGKRVLTASNDGTARIWDVVTGRETTSMEGGAVFAARFFPDGQRVITGHYDSIAVIWDIKSSEQLHVLRGHSQRIGAVAVSPDGQRVATAGGERTVRIWDAQTGKELLVVKPSTGTSSQTHGPSLSFSPDGRNLLVVGATGTSILHAFDPAATPEDIETFKVERYKRWLARP